MGPWPEGCLSCRPNPYPDNDMKHLRIVASFSFAALLGIAACSDVTAPKPVQAPPPNALLGGLLDPILGALPIVGKLLVPDTVVVLQRAKPLYSNVTQAKLIGSGGGQITIPSAGLTLTVPSGAVDYPILVSVTALSGRGVAYEFGPAGSFKKPLTVKQDLSVTTIDPRTLPYLKFSGGYFKTRQNLLSSLLAIVFELLPATTNASNGTVQFNVTHFSGYLIAVDFRDE
jgi:hypothetical protein